MMRLPLVLSALLLLAFLGASAAASTENGHKHLGISIGGGPSWAGGQERLQDGVGISAEIALGHTLWSSVFGAGHVSREVPEIDSSVGWISYSAGIRRHINSGLTRVFFELLWGPTLYTATFKQGDFLEVLVDEKEVHYGLIPGVGIRVTTETGYLLVASFSVPWDSDTSWGRRMFGLGVGFSW